MRIEEYEAVCHRKIDRIIQNINARNIYIWGAGQGGSVVLNVLKQYGVEISGFIDIRAKELEWFMEYPVRDCSEMTPEKDYLIISLRSFDNLVCTMLDQLGYTGKDCFYIYEDEVANKNDIVYKNCKVGRYTYGYENLLEYAPLAKSIGRFCSINSTARIWDNHSLNCITTHPILDRQEFLPWDFFDQRRQFLNRYGIYEDYYEGNNKSIRNNRSVTIGNDVWIGANVIILPGLTIGDGAVLAAGAVVTKNVDPYAIVAGIPAKPVRYRFTQSEIQAMLKIKWWNWDIEKILENLELFYQPEMFLHKYMR